MVRFIFKVVDFKFFEEIGFVKHEQLHHLLDYFMMAMDDTKNVIMNFLVKEYGIKC